MMDLYEQRDLITEISPFLDRFSWKTHDLGNCRCPICGDSKKKVTKKRFYFFLNEQRNGYVVKCHNCGYASSLISFVKSKYPDIYNRQTVNNLTNKDNNTLQKPAPTKPKVKKKAAKLVLRPVSNFDEPYDYLKQRGLREDELKGLYFIEDFAKAVEPYDEDHERFGHDPRIIFPFKDFNGNLFGFQGRRIDKGELRYITFMIPNLYPQHPKMFGMDRIDPNERVYILEGPIDSLFLPNAIASAGSDLVSCANKLQEVGCEDFVFVFDNEPRNKQISDKIEFAIEQGYNVCLLPESMTDKGKDVNDYILSGFSREFILNEINTHTFSGLRAKVEFSRRRII